MIRRRTRFWISVEFWLIFAVVLPFWPLAWVLNVLGNRMDELDWRLGAMERIERRRRGARNA